MLLTCGKYLFELISAGIVIILCLQIFFPKKIEKSQNIIPFLGGLFILYVLSGILLILLSSSIINEAVILLFILSPFVIGKLVRFEKLKFYGIMQIVCVALSMGFAAFI